MASEGADSTPSSSSPTIAKLSTMSLPQITELVETSVDKAETAQEEADAEAEAAQQSGGDGDGGGC